METVKAAEATNFGHDLAGLSVELFQLHEESIYKTIFGKNQEIDRLVIEMEDLQHFLTLLENASASFEKDDPEHVLEVSHEDANRIQRLSQNPELGHIFPPAKFSWNTEEIPAIAKDLQEKLSELCKDDNLKRMVSQRIEGPLQRQINMKSDEIMHEQLDLSKTAELFNRGMHRMLEFINKILTNIQRVH